MSASGMGSIDHSSKNANDAKSVFVGRVGLPTRQRDFFPLPLLLAEIKEPRPRFSRGGRSRD